MVYVIWTLERESHSNIKFIVKNINDGVKSTENFLYQILKFLPKNDQRYLPFEIAVTLISNIAAERLIDICEPLYKTLQGCKVY